MADPSQRGSQWHYRLIIWLRVGLEALGRYRRSHNKVLGEYTERPVHGHASYAGDALCTLSVGNRAARPRPADAVGLGSARSDWPDCRDGDMNMQSV